MPTSDLSLKKRLRAKLLIKYYIKIPNNVRNRPKMTAMTLNLIKKSVFVN
jgi:hypothetical protein